MPITYRENDNTISTHVDKDFHIVLPSAAMGGYELHVGIEDDEKIILQEHHSQPSGIGGATEKFTFKAVQAGETFIHFSSKRPWEDEVDKTYRFLINIKEQ